MQVKLMKTMTIWTFQWNNSRRIWNIKKLWKYMLKILPKKTYGGQYMKLLMLHFLKNQIFPRAFLDLRKNPNQTQFLIYEVKLVLKIMDMKQGFMHKCSWSVESILIIKREIKRPRNITSKVNLKYWYSGLILIMSA